MIDSIYLKPGELYFGNRPKTIITVLGSCVGVTMYHLPSGLAAICHAVQPNCKVFADCRHRCNEPYRYVNCVVRKMVEEESVYRTVPEGLLI